jgi:DNA-directed RNA polymerase specialized sigma24 family protein
MSSQPITLDRDAESINRLVRHVASRDRAAFRRLHRRLVHQIFTQVRVSVGDTASAVAVTRAVFVEAWRLAPTSAARHDDALGWLTAITARRVADRLRTIDAEPSALAVIYDEHIRLALAAILARPHVSRSRPGTDVPHAVPTALRFPARGPGTDTMAASIPAL